MVSGRVLSLSLVLRLIHEIWVVCLLGDLWVIWIIRHLQWLRPMFFQTVFPPQLGIILRLTYDKKRRAALTECPFV
jgi:hypothetical protein